MVYVIRRQRRFPQQLLSWKGGGVYVIIGTKNAEGNCQGRENLSVGLEV